MNDALFSVKDQVVIVSGGSRGIGKAIAAGFGERGAQVVITGRDEKTLAETSDQLEGQIKGKVCDVAQAEDIAALVEHVVAEHGRIETLVNVAGVNRRKPALEILILVALIDHDVD